MNNPQSESNKTPPPNPGSEQAAKPNGGGGDPISDAPEITPEYAKIAEA